MERSFIIPIAVAAGVHSMLFISGTPTTNPPPETPPVSPVEPWVRVDEMPIDLEDPIKTDDASEKPSEAKAPPVGQERLISLPDPDDFVQAAKLEDLRPRPISDINTIDTGWENA